MCIKQLVKRIRLFLIVGIYSYTTASRCSSKYCCRSLPVPLPWQAPKPSSSLKISYFVLSFYLLSSSSLFLSLYQYFFKKVLEYTSFPKYSVLCRRLSPGRSLFESIRKGMFSVLRLILTGSVVSASSGPGRLSRPAFLVCCNMLSLSTEHTSFHLFLICFHCKIFRILRKGQMQNTIFPTICSSATQPTDVLRESTETSRLSPMTNILDSGT